ncbi:maleylpyruvate isomerase family mycothiol-dependent enzyme [Streptomyces sp. AJS327]|uniref:maleylpyruvate isomerase family mycothiol-dependent enzyme n=1 Tax=Streptomyces sp. AJS327 TaxID=2545265 RepID=UPI0015DE53A4|nr:maleylpyruvate isomerase family mycothiol-dependent enzyme [Streptomyces sp. AJS327]MBA0053546.1 maleylpyruvate isomerase family mycothiol-dependent enzyme [Streptomyces sp. AJS327]
MSTLDYTRYTTELVAQTDELRGVARTWDLAAAVVDCPGWTLGQLLRHVGNAHRWAESAVRARATEPVPEDLVNEVGSATADPDQLDTWLAEGVSLLVEALGAVHPEEPMWTPGPGGNARFWARRMLHETVVHRADASRAAGAEFTLVEDVAADGVAEWMGFGTVPEIVAAPPGVPPLLGPGRRLRFLGVDATPDAGRRVAGGPLTEREARGRGLPEGEVAEREWLVDLTGDAVVSGPVAPGAAREDAAVTVRAPLPDLLLLFYRRRTAADPEIEVRGDVPLLDLWLERSGFWLRE